MKKVLSPPDAQGWTYYIDSGIAWIPMYCQGTLVWLRRYWVTWPEKDGSPVMASDVLSADDMKSMMGRDEQMYRAYFPYDPRKKWPNSF
jgi:hypothetical protein